MAQPKSSKRRDQSWYDSLPGGSGDKSSSTFVKAKFVRGELSDQEKVHVKAQSYVWDDVPEHLEQLVEAGYKVTCSQDKYNSAFAVWITPRDEENPNHGLILSARGPTLLAALSVAFYKHYTKFDTVWPRDNEGRERDPWG